MGVRLTPEGDVTGVMPENGMTFTLAELYRYTECDCVDIVRLVDGRWLVCDDEGLLKELPVNHAATALYKMGRVTLRTPIVGPVVVADASEID